MADNEPSITCPACGESFAPAAGALQACPHCGEQFFVDIEEDESDDDREARESIERRFNEEKDRLDKRHIKVVQLEKQSLYRSRSWMLIAALALVGIAGQLVWIGVRNVTGVEATENDPAQPPDPTRATAYFVIAAGLISVSVRFFRRARRYLKEAEAIRVPEPTTRPDFSTLNNGTQIVDHLRSMSEPGEPTEK